MMMNGKISSKKGEALLGMKVAADIQQKMVDLKTPANTPATLAKKSPKANPLIETGALRQHINWTASE